MILGGEILEEIQDQIKIIEHRTIEVDIEEIIEMIIMKEVGVSLEKDNFQIISKGMAEVAVVGIDQVEELVPIEMELDVISVENVFILLMIV